MTEYLSKKIKFISLLAIIGVVFIHAYNYHNDFLTSTTTLDEGRDIFAMIEFIISNAIVRFGVPIFFIISGYLFFRNYEQTIKCYFSKIKKRILSIMVPYIIIIVLSGLLMTIIYAICTKGKFPLVDLYIELAKNDGVFSWLTTPPAFQLSFLLDLFKLVLLAPIIYLLVKKLKLIPVLLALIIWIVDLKWGFNVDAVPFFIIGAYIGIHKKEGFILKKSKKITILASSLWIVCCLVYTYLSASFNELSYPLIVLQILFKAIVILGIISIWMMYDYLMNKWEDSKFLCFLVRNVFVIYLLHEPSQHIVDSYILNYSSSNIMHMVVYFVVSFVFILVCGLIGELMKNKCPKVRKIITGGR